MVCFGDPDNSEGNQASTSKLILNWGSSKRRGKLIYLGRTLVQTQTGPKGVAYSGAVIQVMEDDSCMCKVPSRLGQR